MLVRMDEALYMQQVYISGGSPRLVESPLDGHESRSDERAVS